MSDQLPSENDKSMQKRIEKLFDGEEPPSYLSIGEVESLRRRISELEQKLSAAGMPDGVEPAPVSEKEAAEPVRQNNSTDGSSSPAGRDFRRTNSLSTRILLPTLATFAIALAAFFFYNFYTAQVDYRTREVTESKQAEEFFTSELSNMENFALGLAIQSATNPEIQAAFAERDRAALTDLTLSTYEALDGQFDVPQYQFHLSPAVSFLRLHNPESFGDDLSSFRNTVLEVNDTLKPVAGLEVGRGGMGMRGVVPMFYKGRHTGSVEFGLNIDDTFTARMKEEFGGDWRIILTREALALATLEDISALREGPASNLLVLASTIDSVYAPVDSYTSALNGEQTISRVRENGKTYSISTLPLRDYTGKVIGTVDIVIDRTEIVGQQTWRVVFMLLAMSVALGAGSYSLRRTTNLALKPLTDLTRASEAIERGDLSQQVVISSQDEIGQLGFTFNRMTAQLQNLIGSLEQRVAERTHDLELAAVVGRTITEKVNNMDEMLSKAVDIIRSRFNLYYTQIYLLDPFDETITLRAGTGEVGRQLLVRGHSLKVGLTSINGRAVAEKRAIIVADTEKSSFFLKNDLLPNTRSEMAVPLMVGDRVVGVLDMQSEYPNALNETNLPAFEALSGQLAVAIQNADLFEEATEARVSLEERARYQSYSNWHEFLNAIDRSEKIGFAFQQNKLTLVTEEIADEHAIVAPIQIIGAQVGKIQIAGDEKRRWADADIQVVQAIADQLSRHLDNLRLLSQADKFRHEAEQALKRLTRENWQDYLQIREALAGFVYDQKEVIPLGEAGNSHRSVAYQMPIKVRDELVGELAAAEPSAVTEEEAELIIQQVSENLGTHIENLRLLEQTEEGRARLQISQERLAEALDIARLGNWEYDVEKDLFKFNDQFYSIFRTNVNEVGSYQISSAEYARRFVHPDDAALVGEEIGKAMSTTERFFSRQLEHRIIFNDGSTGHISVHLNVERDENGKIIRWYGANQDITERKLAEEAIRTNEARLSEALNIARLGNWEYDFEKDLFTFNDNFYAVFRTDVETVGSYQMSSAEYAERFVHPDDAPLVGTEIAKALSTTERHFQAQVEHRIFFPDGSLGYIYVSINVDRDENGKIVRWYGANQDITERKLAQNLIAERANQLETVATVSTTSSTVLNPDTLLQTVVDLTKERFSLYHAHIYLADESWNTLMLATGAGDVGRQMTTAGHAIQMDAERSLVARAYRERKAIIVNDIHEDVGFLPNPLLPNTHAEMALPMIVGDRVLGVFDVQSEKAGYFTEEDALIYNTLAAQVAVALQNARLYQEQAATLTQLRELDRLKSSFLANMSHELRTPLNSILGFTDVMLEGLDGTLTPYMQNDLSLIQKNGQHLLHLINDVLDMAKIESGKLNLIVEKFNLHEIFEEVVSITTPLTNEKEVNIFIETDSDQKVEISADRTRLRQVLLNLVNNAVKFTEKGTISIRAIREAKNVLISVKDNGMGIPPAHLESVFQEFTQVDTSTTRKVGGTGLGLPISRRLIQMHGGRLWAESTGIEGEGATFYIFLPLEAKVSEPEITTKRA